ncbi:ARL14 effector protein-like [Platysternon megacephalum]|uniref:ARL14 effector protein-like n=1 Tax=Platysternon megacephalum TaxID=55544 RepID=A0A4D9EMY6_9SAUR|nr:ARL14 effector protein-like [Platysternon megacephalum]
MPKHTRRNHQLHSLFDIHMQLLLVITGRVCAFLGQPPSLDTLDFLAFPSNIISSVRMSILNLLFLVRKKNPLKDETELIQTTATLIVKICIARWSWWGVVLFLKRQDN